MPPYPHLLSPGAIGGLRLRNRIVMAAMGTDLAEDGGFAGPRIRAYYEARARGGVGLIATEAIPVAFPAGFSRPHAMALQEDRQRAAARDLVKAVQGHGARIALQLNHHGPISKRDMLEGRALLVPSEIADRPSDAGAILLPEEAALQAAQRAGAPPLRRRVMDAADIADVTEAFARTALRAREAGADAVEIHAAHGFLLSAFLSPRTNRREDAYGGSQENRARFLIEVVRRIGAVAGRDFPILCKIDAQEFLLDDGITIEDAIVTARLAREAGAVAITASASADPARAIALTESHIPHAAGRMAPGAERIRAAAGAPVIVAGRLEPAQADSLIGRGEADFVAFGRKLLADPDFAAKLAAGAEADIRPCIYCYACISQLAFDRPIKCAVNPETGHESEAAPARTRAPKRIAIVGAGPAGMEAARRLSDAGHAVRLYEAAPTPGGTLRFAALAHEPNQRLLDWQMRQLASRRVETRFGVRADLQTLKAYAPDCVVVAAGARRGAAKIPGADLPHVFTGDDLRALLAGGAPRSTLRLGFFTRLAATAARRAGLFRSNAAVRRLTHIHMPIGRRVVVIGSELVGLELAEFLAHRRRRVAVVDDAPKPGAGLHVVRRARALHELALLGVEIVCGARDIAIEPQAVACRDASGASRKLAADSVIIAKGAGGDGSLAQALRQAGLRVFEIGDATGVGYIEGAMADAAALVLRIEAEMG